MSVNTSRFEPVAPREGGPRGSPVLAATLHWAGRDGLRSTEALILGATGGELHVLADARPARSGPVAVRLGWPAPGGWATATVARARPMRIGPWELRLRLVGRPSATFRTVLGGPVERH